MRRTTRWLIVCVVGGTVGLLPLVGSERAWAQVDNVIPLFLSNKTVRTGPETTPAQSISFGSDTFIFDFDPNTQRAVISSMSDGQGPIIIDNFLTLNGRNICLGEPPGARLPCQSFPGGLDVVSGQVQQIPGSCFCGPSGQPEPEGVDIREVLKALAPIDVSMFLSRGENTVRFSLEDYGVISGNEPVFLVISRKATISLQACQEAAKRARDAKILSCGTEEAVCVNSGGFNCQLKRQRCEEEAQVQYGLDLNNC
jgi:hypothetical protein